MQKILFDLVDSGCINALFYYKVLKIYFTPKLKIHSTDHVAHANISNPSRIALDDNLFLLLQFLELINPFSSRQTV